MIVLQHLRALLGAAFCCALLLAAVTSEATGVAGGAGTAAAPSAATGGEAIAPAGIAPCFAFGQTSTPPLLASTITPSLLAANPAAPGTSRPPPAGPLQKLKQPGRFQITGPITTSSDRLSAEHDGRIKLSGSVDVRMDDREIQADQLIYDRNTNDISASGEVRYSDPTMTVQGDSGHYGNEGAQFTHAHFQSLTLRGRGTANDMSMTPGNVVTLHGVAYTNCQQPIEHADWDIRARELRLDTAANRGVAHGARVDFQGIPILYLPYLSFPLSDSRQSGLLFPNFGSSSRDGVILGVPWYWNIAPNQDATLTPTEYSTRGLDLGTEYRFLSAHDSGTFDGNYLPHDSDYGGERSFVRLLDRLELGDNTRVQTDLESVSDDEYFEDFSQGVQATSTAFLPRSLAISHRDDIWTVSLQTLGFQTVDYTLPVYERPYEETPRLNAAANWSPQNRPWLQTGFDSEVVNFSRSPCTMSILDQGRLVPCSQLGGEAGDFPDGVGVTGWRLDATPHIGLDLSAPGYFFRPTVAWNFAQYALRDIGTSDITGATSTTDGSPDRNLPIVTVDSGLTFDRLAGADGSRTVTLEPRMMYVYIPYRNQDDLPLFDTGLPDPNLIELFRPNRYVGPDRIGDANEFTLGLTSELYSTASGTRYVSATIGQSIYLTPPRVTLPGETLGTQTSDLIGQVNVAAFHDWNVMLDVASNAAITRVEEMQTELQYRVNGQQVANFAYQYAEGLYQQIDGSAAWPILPRWDLYARAVYSLAGGSMIENFAGFQYHSSCWAIRALWQSSLATRTGARDSGVSVQVELTGLSNVGSQVATFLQRSIRGYSPAAGKTAIGGVNAGSMTEPLTP